MKNSKLISTNLKLSNEDVELAQLIGLLHDIGRFDEISRFKKFDGTSFDHADYGANILFENGIIREFIKDEKYDSIIKNAIINHNKLKINGDLDKKTLLHSKIIRDADKLDNFRVKKEEKIENIFPGIVKNIEMMENSKISENVYQCIIEHKCVNIRDRKYPLDYLVCILAFVFDLNFKETYIIIKENNYIDVLIDRFRYYDIDTHEKMEEIRNILNNYIKDNIN